MSANIPTCEELENSYKNKFNYKDFSLILNGKYEIGESANAFDTERLSHQCVLVYEVSIQTPSKKDVLSKKSSLFWYDNVSKEFANGRVAYLYLVEVLPNFQRQGIGTKYANAQDAILPSYDVKTIYLKAGHYGPRFWTKMGYSFVNPELFWMHYQEYCDGYGLEFNDSIELKDIPIEYLNFLRESNQEYEMIKKLSN